MEAILKDDLQTDSQFASQNDSQEIAQASTQATATGILDLPEWLAQLHNTRKKLEAIKKIREVAEAKFREENPHIYQEEADLADQIKMLDAEIRREAVERFRERPENGKTICPGVSIRETTSFKYDSGLAFGWAKEHSICLQLDDKAFKDICKSDTSRPEFVSIEKTPAATIATDLSKFVGV